MADEAGAPIDLTLSPAGRRRPKDPEPGGCHRFPITRWVVKNERAETFFLWQHEKLGWWVMSGALVDPGESLRWRPIVAPLILAVSDGESLTLTFVDWPASHLEDHDWWHDAGPIVRLRVNPRTGWPGDPPVAQLIAGVIVEEEIP